MAVATTLLSHVLREIPIVLSFIEHRTGPARGQSLIQR
jgi:hypothetical protein